MRSIGLFGAGLLVALAGRAVAQAPPPIDPAKAAAVFHEARAICEGDRGRLWGRSLCGPILLVDPETRAVAANAADAKGVLKPQGGAFVGSLPDAVNIANSPTEWSGVRWTMLIWPVTSDVAGRQVLLGHELYHRIQPQLAQPPVNEGDNGHMDTLEGRYLMQLEWRALAKALKAATPTARKAATLDALTFRAARHQLFPTAERDEWSLERNEALAEYTGVRVGIGTPAQRVAFAENDLTAHLDDPTLVRSFAYPTGPAYGLLLDRADPAWRGKVKDAHGLGQMLATATGLTAPADPVAAAKRRAPAYDDGSLRKAEVARDAARRTRLAALRAKLAEGPVLAIPLIRANRQFRPPTLVPLDDLGTVYPTVRISDDWGVLEVESGAGALLSKDLRQAAVSAAGAAAGGAKGDGWVLKLNPGWSVKPSARAGDLMVSADR